ncbi:hypothetical protein TURU_142104 [Turdus rufiventris]|nr:hypothetical protein TURU_142104 [Turdus rufiventris]
MSGIHPSRLSIPSWLAKGNDPILLVFVSEYHLQQLDSYRIQRQLRETNGKYGKRFLAFTAHCEVTDLPLCFQKPVSPSPCKTENESKVRKQQFVGTLTMKGPTIDILGHILESSKKTCLEFGKS